MHWDAALENVEDRLPLSTTSWDFSLYRYLHVPVWVWNNLVLNVSNQPTKAYSAPGNRSPVTSIQEESTWHK